MNKYKIEVVAVNDHDKYDYDEWNVKDEDKDKTIIESDGSLSYDTVFWTWDVTDVDNKKRT